MVRSAINFSPGLFFQRVLNIFRRQSADFNRQSSNENNSPKVIKLFYNRLTLYVNALSVNVSKYDTFDSVDVTRVVSHYSRNTRARIPRAFPSSLFRRYVSERPTLFITLINLSGTRDAGGRCYRGIDGRVEF